MVSVGRGRRDSAAGDSPCLTVGLLTRAILRPSMAENAYHFVDRWRVEADVKEVADILEDALSLPRWWGSVYFEVKEIEPGGEGGIGKLINLRAGGWLPYTLRINFRTVASNYPHGFSMDATGDLEGKGIWTFEPDGRFV